MLTHGSISNRWLSGNLLIKLCQTGVPYQMCICISFWFTFNETIMTHMTWHRLLFIDVEKSSFFLALVYYIAYDIFCWDSNHWKNFKITKFNRYLQICTQIMSVIMKTHEFHTRMYVLTCIQIQWFSYSYFCVINRWLKNVVRHITNQIGRQKLKFHSHAQKVKPNWWTENWMFENKN